MMRQGTRANGFMVKPFEREEFLGRVYALLRGSKRNQKVIVLFERDPALRDTITDSLRGEGYCVQVVEDEAAVVGIARSRHISLMLLDPTSPQQGIDMCRLLRDGDETLHMPILMMATDEVEVAQMVRLNPGVNDFLVKPFHWEELRACVRALLRSDKGRTWQTRATATPKRETIHAKGEILVTDALRIDIDQHR